MSDLFAIVRIPSEHTHEFEQFWKEIRISSGYNLQTDLVNPEQSERFDANALTEWVIPLYEHSSTLIAAVLGYLVARKGEVEVGKYKFKNMSAEDIQKIVEVLKDHARRDKTD
ncbi:hypothetical protein P8T57_16850 [Thalassospira sp. SN3W]|uniref:hypothetical protein n=1 Tax=Thalassospira sp. SN3W TaxID=3035476 RepID=UPI00311ABB64